MSVQSDYQVPFNIPYFPSTIGKLFENYVKNIEYFSDDNFRMMCEKDLKRITNHDFLMITSSCTHSLEIVSLLIKLGPNDEVIMPSYNFTSLATSVTKFGAKPVFVDIDLRNGCIETSKLEDAISKNTKAISWVNYGGEIPDIKEIKEIANKYDLFLIEDDAHSNPDKYYKLGEKHFKVSSFHYTKNVQCGEGGIIYLPNDSYLEQSKFIRDKGTNRNKFVEGQVTKYEWVSLGSSYVLSELSSLILKNQLDNLEKIIQKRRYIFRTYHSELFDWSEKYDISIPHMDSKFAENSHLFIIKFRNQEIRDCQIRKLRQSGVQALSHYVPLHTSKFGKQYQSHIQDGGNSQKFANLILRLPIYHKMGEKEIRTVTQSLLSVN